jgi:hypothetical protein
MRISPLKRPEHTSNGGGCSEAKEQYAFGLKHEGHTGERSFGALRAWFATSETAFQAEFGTGNCDVRSVAGSGELIFIAQAKNETVRASPSTMDGIRRVLPDHSLGCPAVPTDSAVICGPAHAQHSH